MRLPLGVRLTLASTLLVALLVTTLGYLHLVRLRDIQDQRAVQTRQSFETLATQRAETRARDLAVAMREAFEGTELGTLAKVVRELVAQDPQIVYARVADRDARVLADSTRELDVASLPRLDVADLPPPDRARVSVISGEGGARTLEVAQPIVAGTGGAARGVVIFGYDLAPLDAALATLEEERRAETRRSLRNTFVLDAVALVLGALFSLIAAHRFTRPIRELAATASRIASGDLLARATVESSDEVGVLGAQFNHMADRIQLLLDDAISKAELERELNVAREIQSVLVPGPGVHQAPGIEVAGYYEPASVCGGDFWDFAALPRGRASILIGDVTGHGVPAAMLTATAKASVDTLRQVHGENLQVAETMRVLDRVIRDAGRNTFFMTAAVAVVDHAQQTLFFAGAAHPPGLLLRWTESGMKVRRLTSRGNRLGDDDTRGFEARRVRVESGDVLVWYTDGLTEAVDADGAQFGTRRLLRLLSRLESSCHVEEVIATVVEELRAFRNGAPLEDDVTLVVGRLM